MITAKVGDLCVADLPKRFVHYSNTVVGVLVSFIIIDQSSSGNNKIIYTVETLEFGRFDTTFCRSLFKEEEQIIEGFVKNSVNKGMIDYVPSMKLMSKFRVGRILKIQKQVRDAF